MVTNEAMGKVFGILKITLGIVSLFASFWFASEAFLNETYETPGYHFIRFIIPLAYGVYFLYSGWTELITEKIERLIISTGMAIGLFYICSLLGWLLETNEFIVLPFIFLLG